MLNEAQMAIIDWLTLLRDTCKRNGIPDSYTYAGVGDFLLQHGVWYEPRPFPNDAEQGAPKSCFANALLFGRTRRWKYVEGYAVSNAHSLAILHGWNLDEHGNLIDSTWLSTGIAYFGVEFSLGRAENAIWIDDGCVLDNPHSKFSLFKYPWKGENFNLRWRRNNKVKRLISQLG